jgi:hypothetical protein
MYKSGWIGHHGRRFDYGYTLRAMHDAVVPFYRLPLVYITQLRNEKRVWSSRRLRSSLEVNALHLHGNLLSVGKKSKRHISSSFTMNL